jgi:L-ascorbate metabolism protein UlaG (beta-lactamase superfamily)
MKRSVFLQQSSLALMALATNSLYAGPRKKSRFRFQLWRHATLFIEVNKLNILVDPMLSAKDTMNPIPNAGNSLRIPMVDLPFSEEELKKKLATVNAILLTHLHADHWDAKAREFINKEIPIICQPTDVDRLKQQGFKEIIPLNEHMEWKGIGITRTGGQHGTGEIGKRMGQVSGYLIAHKKQSLYIAGDTIWCEEVKKVIDVFSPDHIVVNGGGARFLQGDAITMTGKDVLEVSRATKATITVVHLETINHCLEKRKDFRELVQQNHLEKQVLIPDDGSWSGV